jgi:hypothetical protein
MAFGKTFARVAPILMNDFIKEFGLSPSQAAGYVGNFGAESGLVSGQQEGQPIGTVYPIRGHAGGIDWPQWTGWGRGGRRKAFAEFVESRGLPYPSYKASWEFVKHELRTTHAHSLQQVRKTTTVKAAAETAEATYEIAGIKRMGSRIQAAEEALRLYLASPYAQQPMPSPQPAPVNPMPSPAPDPVVPDPVLPPKPWYQSRVLIGALVAIGLPLASRYVPFLAGVNVDVATDKVISAIDLISQVVGGYLIVQGRLSTSRPIAGTQAAENVLQAEAKMRGQFEAAQAQVPPGYGPVRESWNLDQMPAVIQHVTDHQEVMRLATQLPWTEFAALAIKLLPVLTAAKDAAQKVVEQRPPPPPATSDPLDILRQQP